MHYSMISQKQDIGSYTLYLIYTDFHVGSQNCGEFLKSIHFRYLSAKRLRVIFHRLCLLMFKQALHCFFLDL